LMCNRLRLGHISSDCRRSSPRRNNSDQRHELGGADIRSFLRNDPVDTPCDGRAL